MRYLFVKKKNTEVFGHPTKLSFISPFSPQKFYDLDLVAKVGLGIDHNIGSNDQNCPLLAFLFFMKVLGLVCGTKRNSVANWRSFLFLGLKNLGREFNGDFGIYTIFQKVPKTGGVLCIYTTEIEKSELCMGG